jgi:hypothetical protein
MLGKSEIDLGKFMKPTWEEGTDQDFINEPTDSNKSKQKPQKNRRRVDLRVTLHGYKFRLQAYEDTPDGQLLLWLKSLPLRERHERIMEAMLAFYYPQALAWARENDADFKELKDEEIERAAWLSVSQLIAQMESIEFLLIHDANNLDPQQQIEDWETARALVKARLGESRYNYLTFNGELNSSGGV